MYIYSTIYMFKRKKKKIQMNFDDFIVLVALDQVHTAASESIQ